MATYRTADVKRELPDEEFTVECESGKVYSLPHPKSIPGQDLIYMDTTDIPGTFMILLGDDYYSFMKEPEMDGFALDSLFEAWAEHYGLPLDPGNGRGPRRPSTGSRKR